MPSESCFNPSRRKFIRTFTLLTATSSLLGRTWTNTLIAQVLPKGGVLRLRLSDFPALQTDFGSVRIGPSDVIAAPVSGAPQCRKPRNPIPSLYPLIINRASGGQFHVLSSECTHEGCAVAKFAGGATGFMQCSGHGSRFRLDGSVIAGTGPANFPLVSYAVELEAASVLRIALPEVFFEFSTMGVAPANTNRLALNFLASTNLTYEVRYQETLGGPSTNVPFSTTPGGTNQASIPGIDDFVTVYVERQGPAGFYQIAMRVSEV
ncbi:MAG TPA: Rieske (2Fe-2S) protein [Verrucomicrobiae bacterium]|nr:Rieske (2Fe-2S) protein [Verrucomicrobiae bacterium]